MWVFWLVCDQHWLIMRQMPVEGGFQGRTNKLVDGCYSFWQGATFAVVTEYEAARGMSAGSHHWSCLVAVSLCSR
jgi:prenyltransferase beta subunit